jgi:hypothetical protein
MLWRILASKFAAVVEKLLLLCFFVLPCAAMRWAHIRAIHGCCTAAMKLQYNAQNSADILLLFVVLLC